MRPATDLPERARVVIVGGGVIGCSIAYHLAHLGWTDVLLVERDRLTSGTTWHAAGLVTTFGSRSPTSTAIRLYGRELFARLEAETGQATGFRPVGLVEAAADADRLHEYRRVAAFQRTHGLEAHEVSPREMAELFPLARVDDLTGGFWVPGDGRVDPVDLTMAFAKGARALGVRIAEGVTAQRVLSQTGRAPHVTGIEVVSSTDPAGARHVLECEVVVNATGMWAREFAAASGVLVPNQAAEHYYLVTEPIAGVHPALPIFEDPAAFGYYREEGGGLLVGFFEPRAAPWGVDGIPHGSSFARLQPDWERLEPYMQVSMARVPATLTAGIRTLFCGPESFTPDLQPAVGEAPELPGYFVCAGLNSVGILSSGGMGRLLAQWITSGDPGLDVSAIDVARFDPHQLTPRHRVERTVEVLGTVYAAHPPGSQLRSVRGVKRTPLHDRLVALGACLTEIAGWEVPDWFAAPGTNPQPVAAWHLDPGAEWVQAWRGEHEAVRNAVGLLELSGQAKLLVEGPGAAQLIHAVTGDGSTSDWTTGQVTVAQLREDRLLVIVPDAVPRRALAGLRKLAAAAAAEVPCRVTDATAAYALLGVHGPRSRELLAQVTSVGVGAGDFGLGEVRGLDVGAAPVFAARSGDLGELGWDLLVPVEYAGHVHENLVAAGAQLGLRHVGWRARHSLRVEATCPAGLVSVRLLDPRPVLHHGEILLRDGTAVGDIRSGSYGFTVGGAVGWAALVVPTPAAGPTPTDGPAWADWLAAGVWEVDVAGQRHPAEVTAGPCYDPDGAPARG